MVGGRKGPGKVPRVGKSMFKSVETGMGTVGGQHVVREGVTSHPLVVFKPRNGAQCRPSSTQGEIGRYLPVSPKNFMLGCPMVPKTVPSGPTYLLVSVGSFPGPFRPPTTCFFGLRTQVSLF